MSRRCELTGKGAQVGHKVSHSNIKTKRRFLANLVNVTMISDALGRSVKLRISTNALKTVDRRGGLDAFLMKAKEDQLSVRAREIRFKVERPRRGDVHKMRNGPAGRRGECPKAQCKAQCKEKEKTGSACRTFWSSTTTRP